MSILPPTEGARAAELTDDDLQQIVDAFRGSGCTLLELTSGAIRLRLGRRPAESSPSAGGKTVPVAAPFVGTFTGSVAAGQTVGKGAVLGTIRSLRTETGVLATEAGTIAAQLVPEGSFVAFGAPLFEIYPETPEGGQAQ